MTFLCVFKYKEPMITTTAINAIRWLGSYMKIIQELQPIAFEVFQGIIQIVKYFVSEKEIYTSLTHC